MTNQYLEEKVFELEKRVEKIELSKIISDLPSINEPCGDAISREAVMDCYKKWRPYMATRMWGFEKELSELPSVTQKSGKWLVTHLSNMAYCSECDYLFKDIPASIVEHFNYCPNCGARMESEE